MSLFPDPSRLQFSANSVSRGPPQSTTKQPATINTSASTSVPEESLTGLAKARQRALEAKKRTFPEQSASSTATSQILERNFLWEYGRLTCQAETIISPEAGNSKSHGDPIVRTRSTSPSKLRRKLSKSLRRRSKSVDFDAGMKMSISAPYDVTVITSMKPEPARRDIATPVSESKITDLAPQINVPVSLPNEALKTSRTPSPLLEIAEIKKSRHTRQNSSVSSAEADIRPSSETQGADPVKGSRSRSASSGRRPTGVAPEQAARILPMSVKSALSLHAHTESMGYMVLLPHEVVLLNDVILSPSKFPLMDRNIWRSKRKSIRSRRRWPKYDTSQRISTKKSLKNSGRAPNRGKQSRIR